MDVPEVRLTAELMRQTMRQWATGVTIVSSKQNDFQHGMTVSSFTSVSLEPPLVLVSLQNDSRTHELVLRSGIFGVTILAENQQAISDRFAGRHTEDSNRFAGLETFVLVSGTPFIAGGLAYFDCRVVTAHAAGNHTLFLGEVLAAREGNGESPLIYYDRGYRKIQHSG